MGSVDAAFSSIPKDMTGFYIWRIENLQLVPVDRKKYGDFYTGDAYIIYSVTNYGEQGGANIKPAKLERSPDYRIHFWLGADCSIDERTVACYKAVELDRFFDDAPVQHREVQGHESLRFHGYFPNGIRYLQGGVKTGLKEATDGFRPRLFIVKGVKKPVARELPEISWNQMNDGDAFVLDAGEIIYIYIGRNSNRKEQYEANSIAQLFKDQPGEKIIRVEDGKEEFQLTEANRALFEKFLPLSKKMLAPHDKFTDDATTESVAGKLVRLFKCSDASGKVEIKLVKSSKPVKTDLDSNDCFIIDAGRGQWGLWVWIGKKATEQERNLANKYAQAFIKQENYPDETPLVRVVDGAEPFEFKALFEGRWQ